MPVFRITGGARLYQHWPGEEGCGVDTVSSGVGVGTFANPGNFYSNPEWGLGYEEAIRRWQAAETRGSVADYDYFKQDEALSAGMLGTDPQWAYVIPSSWRVPQIWDEFTAGEAPPVTAFPWLYYYRQYQVNAGLLLSTLAEKAVAWVNG